MGSGLSWGGATKDPENGSASCEPIVVTDLTCCPSQGISLAKLCLQGMHFNQCVKFAAFIECRHFF